MFTIKGGIAWQLLVNAIYDFFWTTAHKRMDLINGQRASVRATDRSSPHASVSRMLHASEYVGLLRSRRPKSYYTRLSPKSGHGKDTWSRLATTP